MLQISDKEDDTLEQSSPFTTLKSSSQKKREKQARKAAKYADKKVAEDKKLEAVDKAAENKKLEATEDKKAVEDKKVEADKKANMKYSEIVKVNATLKDEQNQDKIQQPPVIPNNFLQNIEKQTKKSSLNNNQEKAQQSVIVPDNLAKKLEKLQRRAEKTANKIKKVEADIINFQRNENDIKKKCEAIANSVKISTYDAFKITDPANATWLSLEQYNQTYSRIYNTLSQAYKTPDTNIKKSKSLKYQESDIEKSDDEESDDEESDSDNEESDSDNEESYCDTKTEEKAVESVKIQSPIIEPSIGWKTIKPSSKVKSTIEIAKQKKQEQLDPFAKTLALQIINKEIEYIRNINNEDKNYNEDKNHNEDNSLHTIIVDCTGITLGEINGWVIYPNKFLDSTFVANNNLNSSAHHQFKKIFLNMLKENIGEDHNLHVRFDKDSIDPLVFNIRFFRKRRQDKFITHRNMSTDSKIQVVKKF